MHDVEEVPYVKAAKDGSDTHSDGAVFSESGRIDYADALSQLEKPS